MSEQENPLQIPVLTLPEQTQSVSNPLEQVGQPIVNVGQPLENAVTIDDLNIPNVGITQDQPIVKSPDITQEQSIVNVAESAIREQNP